MNNVMYLFFNFISSNNLSSCGAIRFISVVTHATAVERKKVLKSRGYEKCEQDIHLYKVISHK